MVKKKHTHSQSARSRDGLQAKAKSTLKSGEQRRQRSPNGKSSKQATTDPVILLHVMARMLTECERAGIHPKLKHGIIYTDVGYVLPVKDDKWAARPLKQR
jgi:hypothetical protein